jgi:hypothetical protein
MRIEVYDDNISPLLIHLIGLERHGVTLGHIDESHMLTCDMEKIPIHWIRLNPEEHRSYDDTPNLYVIPNDGNGDILHSIRIHGPFKSASIFQNSFIDGQLVFDNVTGEDLALDAVTTLSPFPYSGIPLEQVQKHIYLEVVPVSGATPPVVEFGYGFLDVPMRRKLEDPSFYYFKGVSLLHKSGVKYGIFGTNALGQSINVIGPEA